MEERRPGHLTSGTKLVVAVLVVVGGAFVAGLVAWARRPDPQLADLGGLLFGGLVALGGLALGIRSSVRDRRRREAEEADLAPPAGPTRARRTAEDDEDDEVDAAGTGQ